ncbi:MAG: hypothetical protein RQ990_01090 [Candidatus Hydrothermia bacterium]|jgi:cell division protein FtsL|nr:hypothetical protein [Candidatus Hydrothermia bacterium]
MWILASVLIVMATLNLGLVIYLIYLIIKMGKAVDKIGEKADKIELNKIGKKLEELESENTSIIEKIVNGASKEEIKAEIELIKKLD